MRRFLFLLTVAMVSNSAGAMDSDDQLRDIVYNSCSGEVFLLATTGLVGLLFSAHEESVVGALFFLPMVVAAFVCAERAYMKNKSNKALVDNTVQSAMHEKIMTELAEKKRT
jgi:hypothetical protein